MRGWAMALLLLGAFCHKDKEVSRNSEPSPKAGGQGDGGAGELRAGEEPARPIPISSGDFVILRAHERKEAQARYLPVRVHDGDPVTMAPGEVDRVDAIPRERRPRSFRSVAASDGVRWVAATRDPQGAPVLKLFDPGGGGAPRAIALSGLEDRQIAALHLVGDHLYVGTGDAVGHVDLGAREATFTPLHQRKQTLRKAYDLFVRDGQHLVAIDDEVTPIYAELFALDPDTGARHLKSWEMPGLINGHYHDGALRNADASAADGTLYLLASYGIMTGNGQDLVALAIHGGDLDHGSEVTINATVHDDPPVLEESIDDTGGTPNAIKLAAGSAMTRWSGLALLPGDGAPETIALAAGARGILLVPAAFGPKTRARAQNAGGACSDVKSRGSLLFALIATPDGQGELAVYRFAGGALTEVARQKLPQVFDRFVP